MNELILWNAQLSDLGNEKQIVFSGDRGATFGPVLDLAFNGTISSAELSS